MTPRMQKCGNLYLKGMSMRQAMIQSGYTEQYAESHCTDMLKNRELIKYIKDRQRDEAQVALADAIMVKKKLVALTEHSDPYVALNALKQLDAHNEWMAELEAKFKQLEVAQSGLKESPSVVINLNEIKKDV